MAEDTVNYKSAQKIHFYRKVVLDQIIDYKCMRKVEEFLTVNKGQNVAFSSLKVLVGDSKRKSPKTK